MSEFYDYGNKILTTTKFVVKNIAPGNKTIKIFSYPILNGTTRDLLAIPGVSEGDIRHSLLRGDLYIKLQAQEAVVVDADIDLLQFNDDQKAFLKSHGVNKGLEVDASSSTGLLTAEQHEILRQLIHFIDEGPGDGFASGAFKVIVGQPLPSAITWYVDNTQTKKIVEKLITYTAAQPTLIIWNMYDTDGIAIAHTVTDTITYTSNAFESTRTRTIS